MNTLQVYSLDYTEQAQRRIKYVDTLDEETFYEIAQKFYKTFLLLFNSASTEHAYMIYYSTFPFQLAIITRRERTRHTLSVDRLRR